MSKIIHFLLNFGFSVSLAGGICRVGCRYVSPTGMPSGGCGSNYQDAMFAAQKNCIENINFIYQKLYEKSKLREVIQNSCAIPGASENLLESTCDNFVDDREFFAVWKKQVCRYKKEIVFTKNLIWSKWYECVD